MLEYGPDSALKPTKSAVRSAFQGKLSVPGSGLEGPKAAEIGPGSPAGDACIAIYDRVFLRATLQRFDVPRDRSLPMKVKPVGMLAGSTDKPAGSVG